MTLILFWVLMSYDLLVDTPYFWVKVALGIATGLFIPSRIAGLLACAFGNAAIVSYEAFVAGRLGFLFNMATQEPNTMFSVLVELLTMCLFLFIGVVWWFVGRIMRWAFYKIARLATKSTMPTPP